MKFHHSLSRLLAVAALAAASFSVTAESLGPTLDRISERGVVFLGHREDSVPFSFITHGNDEPDGFSIEICRHVIKAIEEKVGKKLVTQPVVMSPNSRIMMVKAGMADMECGVTTNTVGRSQQVAFSTTFFVSEVKGMVKTELVRIPANLDTDSTPNWTRIPEQTGQSERSDAGFRFLLS